MHVKLVDNEHTRAVAEKMVERDAGAGTMAEAAWTTRVDLRSPQFHHKGVEPANIP